MSAFSAWIIAQILKVFTGVFKEQRFHLKNLLFGTGGMPSSHTASVSALATSIVITEGFGSPLFAIAGLLLMVVMIDATGVRQETGRQSKALNIILEELFTDPPKEINRHFKELVGHTPLQVFFGFLTGILVAILLHFVPWWPLVPVA
jgi:acid phosphatase family membrane protein YuiD